MTAPDHTERGHREFPLAVWTSFDRYGRYGTIARAVRSCLGPGRHQVLDVGESAGYLPLFDPNLDVIGVDIEVSAAPLEGAVRVLGDGRSLPFLDGSFDAVVSSDTLEHVPGDGRSAFLAELSRVSRDLVVVAAPFDTPGVAGAEELVRRFALLATGEPQVQLEEHRVNVLPRLEETENVLREYGLSVISAGSGNLHDWLLMMLVKYQLGARPALKALVDGYDILYNALLAARNDVAPYYRHVVVGRPAGRVDVPSSPAGVAVLPRDVSGLLAGLLAANVSEAARQDTTPRLDELLASASAVRAEFTGVQTRLDELAAQIRQIAHGVGQIEEFLPALVERVEARMNSLSAQLTSISTVLSQLRHPVRALRRGRGSA